MGRGRAKYAGDVRLKSRSVPRGRWCRGSLLAVSICVFAGPGLAQQQAGGSREQPGQMPRVAQWRAYPNLVVVSRLGYPARYVLAVDEKQAVAGSVEPLVGLKRIGGATRSGIEAGGEMLVEGTDIGLLGAGAATEQTSLTGTYRLEGLDPGMLVGNTWGGAVGVTDILGDETSIIESIEIARFTEPHFVRLCITGLSDPDATGETLPLVAFSVDGKAVRRSAPGAGPDIAMWHHGCVDLAGTTFAATLVRRIDPDDPLPPFPGRAKVTGRLSFAPLAKVRATTELSNLTPPPHLGGTFEGGWRTVHRNAVLAYNLPFDAKYAVSYIDTVNDGMISNATLTREAGKPDILVHEAGGVVLRARQLALTRAVPSGIGTMTLIGYGRGDFRTSKFSLTGDAQHANSAPQVSIARFREPQLMRVCIESSRLVLNTDGRSPPPARFAHATLYADGRPVLPGGLPVPIAYGCTDLAAKTVDLGLFGDRLLDPGDWRITGTLYHRPLPAN